jgi:hypothetical protein
MEDVGILFYIQSLIKTATETPFNERRNKPLC